MFTIYLRSASSSPRLPLNSLKVFEALRSRHTHHSCYCLVFSPPVTPVYFESSSNFRLFDVQPPLLLAPRASEALHINTMLTVPFHLLLHTRASSTQNISQLDFVFSRSSQLITRKGDVRITLAKHTIRASFSLRFDISRKKRPVYIFPMRRFLMISRAVRTVVR